MAIFLTTVTAGVPKFSDRPGAHWRLSPDGTQAIVEFFGTRRDYARAKAESGTTELTRRDARALGRRWDGRAGGRA